MPPDPRLTAAQAAAQAYAASLGPSFEASAVTYAGGRALAMAGRHEEALATYLVALDAPTARGWPYLMNALVASAQACGREEEAARALALRAGRLIELHLWQGHLLRIAGLSEQALAPLERAQALTEGALRYTAVTERLRALAALSRFDEARAVCTSAIQTSEDGGLSLRVSLAALMGQEGRYEDALAELDAVLARAPGLAEAHLNRGGALLRLGRPEEGRAALELALRLNPGLAGEAARLTKG